MKDKLTFRYVTSKDISLIHSLKKMIEEWMFVRRKAEVIYAVLDGKEIGFSLFYESFAAYVGKGGIFIDDPFIEPEYRGKGYGKVLFEAGDI